MLKSTQAFVELSPSTLVMLGEVSSGDGVPLRQAAELLKNRHPLDDARSALCRCFRVYVCLLARHMFRLFSSAAAQVTANFLKPLKLPENTARARRVGQL